MKSLGIVLLLVGFSGFSMAGALVAAPEISPISGVTAIALISGAMLVVRGRRKK